jgi:hypothetical protein
VTGGGGVPRRGRAAVVRVPAREADPASPRRRPRVLSQEARAREERVECRAMSTLPY